MTFSYDAVRYQSYPYFETHPAHLGAVAALFSFAAVPGKKMRYLEIGCSAGGNILPLAAEHPEAELLGIDLAETEIAKAQAIAEKLGLTNLTLKHMDLTKLDASYGAFDFIVVHGVYSWVPAPVREKLLDVIGQLLSPRGIAVVSHNTKPGCAARQVARDLMLFSSRNERDPGSRTARARKVLAAIAQDADAKEGSYRQMLGEQVTMVGSVPDWYLFHDYLSESYFAEYFYEFVDRIESRGLQFLSDSRFAAMFPSRLPESAQKTLDELSADLIEYEQYRDFLTNRSFRFTVLCRQGLPIERSVPAARLESLYVGCRMKPQGEVDLGSDAPAVFMSPAGQRSEIVAPLDKATLLVLGRAWPAYRSVVELAVECKALAQSEDSLESLQNAICTTLLGLYSHDVISLRNAPPAVEPNVPERPRISPLCRLQCETTMLVVNQHHELYQLRGKEREILRLLDGTRTADDVATALGLAPDDLATTLAAFARAALFVS